LQIVQAQGVGFFDASIDMAAVWISSNILYSIYIFDFYRAESLHGWIEPRVNLLGFAAFSFNKMLKLAGVYCFCHQALCIGAAWEVLFWGKGSMAFVMIECMIEC
jgi:hypothetical protein